MKRLTGDTLRVLATLAVVLIHGTSFSQEPFRLQHDFLSADFAAVLIGQSLRFSVPIFLILSGYGLTLRYGSGSGGVNLREFFDSRASKILVPFLVWSLAMLFFSGRIVQAFQGRSAWDGVLAVGLLCARALFLGNADYHLYFFSIILQCYILFPILTRLPGGPLLFLFAMIQLVYASPVQGLLYRHGFVLPAVPSPVCVYWLAYFQLGIVSAKHAERLTALAGRFRSAIVVGCIASLVWLLAGYIEQSYRGHPPGTYDHFNRVSVIAFSVLFWATALGFDDWISETVTRHGFLNRAIPALAGISFTVYLIHPNLLRLLRLVPLPIFVLNLTLLVLAVSVGLALFALVKSSPLRIVLGLPAPAEGLTKT